MKEDIDSNILIIGDLNALLSLLDQLVLFQPENTDHKGRNVIIKHFRPNEIGPYGHCSFLLI